MATVTPFEPFHPQQDAEHLRKAMKGLGTDEQALINILCKRTDHQRQKIKMEYKQMYGRDLTSDVKSECSGHFEKVLVSLLLPAHEYDAVCIKKACEGLGTDDDCLIEILCSRSNQEIAEIRESFKKLYHKELEKEIAGDTSGDYKRLLIQLQNGGRSEDEVHRVQAVEDAKKLHGAMEGAGTDEETLRLIFATRSFAQLNETFNEYKVFFKKDITEAIKGELSFNFKQAMLAIIACARNRPEYFADRLLKTMKGAGTDERALTRLVVSRCEKDMVQIKEAFHRRNKKTLEKYIEEDVGGDYKRALVALL